MKKIIFIVLAITFCYINPNIYSTEPFGISNQIAFLRSQAESAKRNDEENKIEAIKKTINYYETKIQKEIDKIQLRIEKYKTKLSENEITEERFQKFLKAAEEKLAIFQELLQSLQELNEKIS